MPRTNSFLVSTRIPSGKNKFVLGKNEFVLAGQVWRVDVARAGRDEIERGCDGYLDGWCHLRNSIRSFALDAVQRATSTNKQAVDVPDDELDRNLKVGYGIFGGADTKVAVIRFSPERSRWVAKETWHPEQKGEYDAEGRWVLAFPYSNDIELVMDILRHGPDTELLEPHELRAKVQERLRAALSVYE
ncbi:MAG: WYL domain-containing protein [Magnetococcus sp. YQC-3]